MIIREIEYPECFRMWQLLWPNRKTPIQYMSAMTYDRSYTQDIGEPIYLGAFVDDVLVGVNSCHRAVNTWRSRGLYVDPAHRGQGIAVELLKRTLQVQPPSCEFAWSYPNQLALNTYLRAGFTIDSQPIFDGLENKFNLYVRTCK